MVEEEEKKRKWIKPWPVSRRNLVIMLMGALLLSIGRIAEYTAWAARPVPKQEGLRIIGIDVVGCDFLPEEVIRSNVMASGLRPGSVIKGGTLITPEGKKIPLHEAIRRARIYAMRSVIPGTKIKPIRSVQITIKRSGVVVVRVIEDYGLPR
ncbi:hypothetical protein [Methanopyrus sp. SNP6]|uniref:hypothetical protein n=1 Tax=Methanopyrus sp. SNP6 TaxID=1937005 RepID=UPI0011E59B24|nr:hypothetical protein [Methanopyrus sp. SNP6]